MRVVAFGLYPQRALLAYTPVERSVTRVPVSYPYMIIVVVSRVRPLCVVINGIVSTTPKDLVSLSEEKILHRYYQIRPAIVILYPCRAYLRFVLSISYHLTILHPTTTAHHTLAKTPKTQEPPNEFQKSSVHCIISPPPHSSKVRVRISFC